MNVRKYSPDWYELEDERDDWRRAQPGRIASAWDRFAELGNHLINSWWVLTPMGLMLVGGLVCIAMGWWTP